MLLTPYYHTFLPLDVIAITTATISWNRARFSTRSPGEPINNNPDYRTNCRYHRPLIDIAGFPYILSICPTYLNTFRFLQIK
jgi:hypothetical protein